MVLFTLTLHPPGVAFPILTFSPLLGFTGFDPSGSSTLGQLLQVFSLAEDRGFPIRKGHTQPPRGQMPEERDLARLLHQAHRDEQPPVIRSVKMKIGKDLLPSIPLRLVVKNRSINAFVFAVIEICHKDWILSLLAYKVAVCNLNPSGMKLQAPVSKKKPLQHHEGSFSWQLPHGRALKIDAAL